VFDAFARHIVGWRVSSSRRADMLSKDLGATSGASSSRRYFWVDWFNHRRSFERNGNVSPAEKEIEYYQQLQGSAMAA